MRTNVFLVVLFCSNLILNNVQSQTILGVPVKMDGWGSITNLSDAIQVRVVDEIPFYKAELSGLSTNVTGDKIKGIPFWNKEWKLAQLIDKKSNSLGFIPAKMNLNNSSVHFINQKGVEVCLDATELNQVIFYKDSSKKDIDVIFTATSNYPFLQKDLKDRFVQVIYEGERTLLEYHTRYVSLEQVRKYNDLPYAFKSKKLFYIMYEQQYRSIVKLRKEDIESVLSPAVYAVSILPDEKKLFRHEEKLIRQLKSLSYAGIK